MTLISASATLIALVVALPAFVVLIEVILARASPTPSTAATKRSHRFAVLLPAHNEAAGIAATIRGIVSQLDLNTRADQIVVIADNCNDQTAEVARAAGATVIERTNPALIGKGYALDYGVRFLEADPPEVVIVVDADCQLSSGALASLVSACVTTGRPIQARYLMRFPDDVGGPGARIAELALLVKNWVRPQGLERLELPCPLLGSGMAFPWSIISKVELASGNIVEDMRLGSDLVAAGLGPRFLSEAQVFSTFPIALEGQESQRKRWEHGHLQTLLTQVPKLMIKGVLRADIAIIAYALDLAVPPLALLAMGLIAALMVSVSAWAFGMTILPVAVLLIAIAALTLAVLLAWDRFARDLVPLAVLRSVPAYALGKIPVYLKFILARQTTWVRSKRDSE